MSRRQLAALALAAAVAACTKVDKTSLPPAAPPSLAELLGTYAVLWTSDGGSELSGGAKLDADDFGQSIALESYPCFALTGQQQLGGGFEYDEAGGAITVECKSLDGDLRVVVDGAVDAGGVVRGDYESLFLGVACDHGSVEMRRAQ